MSALHRDDAGGLAGLQSALDAQAGKRGTKGHGKAVAQDILHDWSLAVALDGLVDGGRYHLEAGTVEEEGRDGEDAGRDGRLGQPERLRLSRRAAERRRLRPASGCVGRLPVRATQSTPCRSAASTTVPPPLPVAWTVDGNPPTALGNAALYSGADDERDEAIVRQVKVPNGRAAQLTFSALWNEEPGWDFGFAQVSDDGGATYSSLSCTDTTSDYDPGAFATAVENVPGFSGYSETFRPQSCSLAAYAGKTTCSPSARSTTPSRSGRRTRSRPDSGSTT